MAKFPSRWSSLIIPAKCSLAVFFMVGCVAHGQIYLNREVRVDGLPNWTARSHAPQDVLLTSLEIVIQDKNVCCAKDSALEDSLEKANPQSLKDVASKLQGRQLLSDGRPIQVTAEYSEPAAINAGVIIGTLAGKQAFLLEWNTHLYVCFGAIYDQVYDDNGGMQYSIRKILLLDVRYSGSRRLAVFDRGTDDWTKVQGMLRLTVAAQ